jgi:hypothetical protein
MIVLTTGFVTGFGAPRFAFTVGVVDCKKLEQRHIYIYIYKEIMWKCSTYLLLSTRCGNSLLDSSSGLRCVRKTTTKGYHDQTKIEFRKKKQIK